MLYKNVLLRRAHTRISKEHLPITLSVSLGGGEWREQHTHFQTASHRVFSRRKVDNKTVYQTATKNTSQPRPDSSCLYTLLGSSPSSHSFSPLCPPGVGGLSAPARNSELGLQRHTHQSAARPAPASLSGEVLFTDAITVVLYRSIIFYAYLWRGFDIK